MEIHITTIPHNEQAYRTVGNWQFDENGDLLITVSDLKDWRMEAAIGYHELREALLCKRYNITQNEVDDFDTKFEEIRDAHPGIIGDQEPGDMISAPYHYPHTQATKDEKGLIDDLKVDWPFYEMKIKMLDENI